LLSCSYYSASFISITVNKYSLDLNLVSNSGRSVYFVLGPALIIFFGLSVPLDLHLLHFVAPGGFSAPHFLQTYLFKALACTILSNSGSLIGIVPPRVTEHCVISIELLYLIGLFKYYFYSVSNPIERSLSCMSSFSSSGYNDKAYSISLRFNPFCLR